MLEMALTAVADRIAGIAVDPDDRIAMLACLVESRIAASELQKSRGQERQKESAKYEGSSRSGLIYLK